MIKLLFTSFLITLSFSLTAQEKKGLFIGTYTNTAAKGIYYCAPGTYVPILAVETSNPSYFVVSPGGKNIFTVNENNDGKGKGGSISAFKLDKISGKFRLVNKVSSAGSDPCYISMHPNKKWLAVGNYSSGTVSVFPIVGDSIGYITDLKVHSGNSINKSRQSSPHVHAAVFSPDGKFLYAPDLGTDKVFIYSFNKKTGKLTSAEIPFVQVTEGAGPRHFIFHPNKKHAYLIEEMSGTIVVFDYNKSTGALTQKQTISTVVTGFAGYAGSADIHISEDGKFLYGSNRGDANDLAIFVINKKDGLLSLVAHQSVMGKTPRNFSIAPSGKYIYVANQDSDEIVVFSLDKKTGIPTDTGNRISVPKPVYLQWD